MIDGLYASGLGDSTGKTGPMAKLMGKGCTVPLYVKVTEESVQTYHWCTWNKIPVKESMERMC